jgi:hypothetical protein
MGNDMVPTGPTSDVGTSAHARTCQRGQQQEQEDMSNDMVPMGPSDVGMSARARNMRDEITNARCGNGTDGSALDRQTDRQSLHLLAL